MTARDRLVVVAIAVLALLGGAWMLVVSPERKQAANLATQVSTASSALASAQGQAADARAAQAQYSAAYASIVSLGKAVPPSREVPSLIYQLAQASHEKNVELTSIVSGAGSSASAGSAASSTPSASAANASATVAGFTAMPFTFTFTGSFYDLQHLFEQLNRFAQRTASGGLQVSGRLLTIQSVNLAPSTAEAAGGSPSSGKLTGTITATAYVLPASQGLTGGATAAAPASTTTTTSSTGASSPTAPAVARVNP